MRMMGAVSGILRAAHNASEVRTRAEERDRERSPSQIMQNADVDENPDEAHKDAQLVRRIAFGARRQCAGRRRAVMLQRIRLE